jgi:osmoprotectant transport system permease protein
MSADFIAHLLAHIELSAASLAIAIVLGILVAGLIVDRPAARGLALGLAGGLRVIPSLAILTLALPLLGLGFAPALLALVVLALPPIVINAEVGLHTVPATVLGILVAGLIVDRPAARGLALGLAGGLGDYIVDGLATNDLGELFLGAGTVALLAIVVDRLLALVEHRLSAAT